MGDFWSGWVGQVADTVNAREKRNYDEAAAQREYAHKHAEALLNSDDPDLQMTGLSILQQALQPPKKKKGFAGWLGEYEPPEQLRPLLDAANRTRLQLDTTGSSAPAPAAVLGSAALPSSSPVEPKAQRSGESMLDRAVRGTQFGKPALGVGADVVPPTMGGVAPADLGSNAVTPPSFGGIPLPQQMGAPGAQPNLPTFNLGAVAARVSRDKGVPQPGERKWMFYPSKAQLRREELGADYETAAKWLQQIGATPAETKRAMMAKMGASMGAGNLTAAGYVKIPTPDGRGRTVQTFMMEDPTQGQFQIVYADESGRMVPLPPGYEAQRMTGMGAGPSITSKMTGAQLQQMAAQDPDLMEEIQGLGGVNPRGWYKVTEKGGVKLVQPDQPPNPYTPPTFQTPGGSPYGPRYDASGRPLPSPGMTPNQRVANAKALMARYNSTPAQMKVLPDLQQEILRGLLLEFPMLKGLTLDQIQILSRQDEFLPPEQEQKILQPALPPVPQGATAAPPGDPTTTLPGDWADRLAAALAAQQAQRPRP